MRQLEKKFEDVPETSLTTWQILSLLQPFLKSLVLLSFAAIGLSFLSGMTQVALTPLIEIVLNSTVDPGQVLEPTKFSFDLAHLGESLLYFTSSATGLTNPFQLLLVISLTYLALKIIDQLSSFATRQWSLNIRLQMLRDLRFRIFSHILRLPLSFLNRFQAGWILSRMFNDIRYVVGMISELIIDGLSNILLSLFYLFLLIRTDFRLTFVAAIAATLQMIITQLLIRTAQERVRTEQRVEARMQGNTQERLGTLREIKILTGENYEEQSFLNLIDRLIRAQMRNITLRQIEVPIRNSINQFVLVGVMIFGIWEVLNAQLETSAFVLFMVFAQSLINPLSKLAGLLMQVRLIPVALEGAAYILEQEPEAAGDGDPITSADFQESIKLDNVSFAYDDTNEPITVLDNVSLTINKGEMVALVGRSGAGKSTLVDLILRFFTPTEGQIMIDGKAIEDFNLTAYRRLFGAVSQDGILFDDTVYENIAYARPDLSEEDVQRAARIANAEDFILNDLAEGYDTRLGERGVRVSGGQRQRIAIARAIAHQPAILILDEATSSLDSESEQQVQEAIASVIKESTAIVIAHRLSTIRAADKIVVLREGRIVEQGTHEELLALDGEYRYLYDLQFKGILAPDSD